MRIYADPQHCPDCDATLPTVGPVCPSCRLDLTGPLGQELFATLSRADVLLARLRERSLAGQPGPAASSAPRRTEQPPLPGTPTPTRTPVTAGLSTASVPKILLTLGALCLLVAALVFLAVSWSRMGIGGRTATLVGLTVVAAGITAWSARRGLRNATEALGAVTLGLATLDVVGARDAGWLGTPSTSTFAVIVGLLLVGAGVGTTAAIRRTAAGGFTCGELASVLGAATLSTGLVAGTWGHGAGRALVAVLLIGALGGLVACLVPLRVAMTGFVTVAVVDWLVLVGAGLDRLGTAPSVASVWGRLEGWPLLAAAAVAGGVAAVRTFGVPARVLSLGAATFVLAMVVTAPAYDEGGTTLTLAVLATVTVAAAATTLLPRPWAAAGLAASVPGSIYLVLQLLVLGAHAAGRYAETAAAEWAGTTGGRLGQLSLERDQAPAWTLPLLVLVLAGAGWSATQLTAYGRSLEMPGRLSRVLSGGWLVAVTLAAALLLHPVPVWLVLIVVLTTGAVALAVGLASGRDTGPAALAVGAVTLAVALPLSWYDAWLTLVAVTVALVSAVAVLLRSRLDVPALAAGGLTPPLVAGLVWTVGELGGADEPWVALAALLVLAVLALTAPVAGRLRSLPVELGTLATGVLVGVAGVTTAASTAAADWAAVYLTVGGTAATLVALLRADRRAVGWLGGALLAAATWVRLADLGVDAPEPYTLPSAVALLVTGVLHLRRAAGSSTLRALSPGLTLALVPSLLWALEEPLSMRALLLGIACLALLLTGLQLRWSAPIAHAAFVGALLVVREAGPYVGDSVPRWAVIGFAGALLVVLGATWEQRLEEARAVTGYLRRLR